MPTPSVGNEGGAERDYRCRQCSVSEETETCRKFTLTSPCREQRRHLHRCRSPHPTPHTLPTSATTQPQRHAHLQWSREQDVATNLCLPSFNRHCPHLCADEPVTSQRALLQCSGLRLLLRPSSPWTVRQLLLPLRLYPHLLSMTSSTPCFSPPLSPPPPPPLLLLLRPPPSPAPHYLPLRRCT